MLLPLPCIQDSGQPLWGCMQALLEVMEAGGSPAKQKLIGDHAEACATAVIRCIHALSLEVQRLKPLISLR